LLYFNLNRTWSPNYSFLVAILDNQMHQQQQPLGCSRILFSLISLVCINDILDTCLRQQYYSWFTYLYLLIMSIQHISVVVLQATHTPLLRAIIDPCF
jgi:hypothetical protein